MPGSFASHGLGHQHIAKAFASRNIIGALCCLFSFSRLSSYHVDQYRVCFLRSSDAVLRRQATRISYAQTAPQNTDRIA
jgi:hypothetical protein